MLINSFFNFLAFCMVSLILCSIGYVITFVFQSKELANQFFISWIFNFNGILVGGTGYGLMWYINKEGKNLLGMLNNFIDVKKLKNLNIVVYSHKANSWTWKIIIGVPITIIGGIILWSGGYPLQGFSKYYLAICSISLYFVASYILTFFIYIILMFKALEEELKDNPISKIVPALEYETINNFFTITATIGIFGLYFGFRGTLTANLDILMAFEPLRKLFILPVILFLPIALVYSFYPRYILKKIYDMEIINQLRKLENIRLNSMDEDIQTKERLDIEKTVSEIKEKLLAERKQLPIINYKDSPSLGLVILMLLQLIVQYDKVINDFFKIF
ncbi:MAG: hypothetical protein WC209_18280 [Ignavibacteriaceae bacterium]|jgi:hypothetical protein